MPPVQLVGYQFNADQMIRLAKGLQGVDVTDIEGAWVSCSQAFRRPPGSLFFAPHLRRASRAPLRKRQLYFCHIPQLQNRGHAFRKCRRIPRFKQANGYLKALGISRRWTT